MRPESFTSRRIGIDRTMRLSKSVVRGHEAPRHTSQRAAAAAPGCRSQAIPINHTPSHELYERHAVLVSDQGRHLVRARGDLLVSLPALSQPEVHSAHLSELVQQVVNLLHRLPPWYHRGTG